MKRRILHLAALVFSLAFSAPAARADVLSAEDKTHFRAALEAAVDHGAWDRAYRFAAETKNPLAQKVLRWLSLSDGSAGASFAELTEFITANPDWPRQVALTRRAEEAMNDAVPNAAVLAWFKDRSPQSPMGMVRLAEAQWQTGKKAEAEATIKRAWVEMNFDAKFENDFLKAYGRFIDRADHWARLDRLLWDNKADQAKRMLKRVDAGHQALAEARMHLRASDKSADYSLKRVPDGLLEDPGLKYERARWRRKKNRDAEALLSFTKPDEEASHAEQWWDERAILARRLLADGAITDAYKLAKNHGPLDGVRLVSAEWFAGWVALRYLNEPKTALPHFTAAFDAARTPLSQSRGAYWTARAYEAAHDAVQADSWYRRAAELHYTFYGQLAAERAHLPQAEPLPDEPRPTEAETKAFESRELVRVTRMLGEAGRDDLFKTFAIQLGQKARTSMERTMAGRLAVAFGRREVGVQIGRDAMRDGVLLPAIAFPMIDMPKGGPEPALLHAVVRQESNFDIAATSVAGARGLMQLIPSTARAVSRALNINYQPDLLGRDGHYNVRLGQAYLGDMIGRYDGSYVLALAAYNAGPGSVARWVRTNGDPRQKGVDVVDWIEQVPYEETRNYIQRVLENLQVYRRRLGGSELVKGTIEADLRRGAEPRG
jgi:soluble lytic murein transglycosylase